MTTRRMTPVNRTGRELAAQTNAVIVAKREVALDSDTGRALIEDFTRYTEGLLEDKDLCGAWRISLGELAALKNDPHMFEAVRHTKYRREQDGSAAREAARKAFLKAPRVLEQILDDPLTPPRGRIEASRELRAAAAFPSDPPLDAREIVSIFINLGDDVPPVRYSGPKNWAPSEDSTIIDAVPSRQSQRITKDQVDDDE